MFRTRRRANRYRNFGLLLLLASVVSFYLGYETSRFVLFLVGCGFLVGAYPLFQKYRIWGSGAKGEEKVAKCLKSLGGKYHVFHDVVLPRARGDIDHVVVGSNGVFVIETKNNNGTINCNGDSWSQLKTGKKGGRYRGKIGSPSKQAKRNAISLGNLIGRRLHKRLFVNALVVFANKKAVLNITNPTVSVLQPPELCDFIENFRSKPLSNNEQTKIVELIEPYSRYT
jgi:hypothetical protein